MSANRRDFLQRLAVGGVAASVLPGTLHAAGTVRDESPAFNELHAPEQQAQTWDTTWPSRITGKYRAVFDVPLLEGGSGVWRAGLWRNHYRDFMKAEPADISPVLVIRHSAIPFIMTQEFWETYEVAKTREILHPMTEKKTMRNPVLMNAEVDKLPPTYANMTLDKQMELGTIVIGCNMAFFAMTSLVAKKDKVSNSEARTKALSMMLPGVILQPNGIFGLTLAQENGCSFIAAS